MLSRPALNVPICSSWTWFTIGHRSDSIKGKQTSLVWFISLHEIAGYSVIIFYRDLAVLEINNKIKDFLEAILDVFEDSQNVILKSSKVSVIIYRKPCITSKLRSSVA